MPFISETIYPGDEANSSLDFKLVRFAREFRSKSITRRVRAVLREAR